jgi:mannose-6-phosphate isomerase-like protein (cupin superfamily)
MRSPFRKSIGEIEKETAHAGSGVRQLLLSKADPVSSQFEAMAKTALPARGAFDWHSHIGVDEFFVVLNGTGVIRFRDGSQFTFGKDDLIYIPADLEHRIENIGSDENLFYFVRFNA